MIVELSSIIFLSHISSTGITNILFLELSMALHICLYAEAFYPYTD